MTRMTDLPWRPGREGLRPSDRDREQIAELLREATAEGRIDFAELDERLSAAYGARTYAALDVVTRDLPVPGRPAGAPVDGGRVSRLALAVFSGFARKGVWTVPRAFTALCLWGGGVLDLREACFSGRDTRIRVFALWGGMKIVVPRDAEVYVNGFGLMGVFGRRASGPGAPGAPRIVIRGLAVCGAVSTKRAPREK
jgi:hypothetical protein